MAQLNLDYYSGKDLYSDGDIENEILEIVKEGKWSENAADVKFPVLYHLTAVRENILNWYPFKKDGSCLEIGSGCGAITGLLCKRLAKVVSVELSKRRAEINFARHSHLENLEIRVGNQNDMDFSEGFDYVVLNGVFEYAMSFTEGEYPYETFLMNVSQFLKPDGVILIAIENRLGLKYFAGAPEDHTDGYFDGIREYRDNRSVRTFSRGEWEKLMKRCGLDHYRFYYPYPDYKFPKEIFTDESLTEQKYGCPTWNFTKYRMALFEEHKMAETLQEEGVVAHFANSFLIEMSRQPLSAERQVVYAKLNTDRSEDYAIGTVLQKCVKGKDDQVERQAVKFPLTESARAHMEMMLLTQENGDYGSWYVLKAGEENGRLIYPFLEKESLGRQAERALEEGNIEKVCDLISRVSEMLTDMAVRGTGCCVLSQNRSDQDKADFRSVFGSDDIWEEAACIAPANIDLILDNIFEDDGRYCVIDCEWVFDFPIPVSFVLWRAVNELYSRNPMLEKRYPAAELLREYDITPEMTEKFRQWATYFAEEYVGANRLLRKSVPEIGVSLEEFRQRLKAGEVLISQLFVDTGKGFSEDEKIVVETSLTDGRFSVAFDISKYTEIQALRFDPLEGKPCICSINKEGTNVKAAAGNAVSHVEQGDLFLTTDPIYQISGKGVDGKVTIAGNITVLSMEDALNRAGQLLQKKNRLGLRSRSWRK